jgi:XTP/dITP diphosphohydrolase
MPHNSPPVADEAARDGAHSSSAGISRLVLASANEGKLRELRRLLADLPFEVQSQAAYGVPAPEETGDSFFANALLKARHAQLSTGTAVLADDSGLEVDALGGAPGVYSARYAGSAADDTANNAKLLRELRDVPPALRTARYRCVLVYLGTEPSPKPLVAEGVWEGSIIAAPRGGAGFGYDPYFFLPDLGLTAAELDADTKNRLSHRGQALRRLQAQLAAQARAARLPA